MASCSQADFGRSVSKTGTLRKDSLIFPVLLSLFFCEENVSSRLSLPKFWITWISMESVKLSNNPEFHIWEVWCCKIKLWVRHRVHPSFHSTTPRWLCLHQHEWSSELNYPQWSHPFAQEAKHRTVHVQEIREYQRRTGKLNFLGHGTLLQAFLVTIKVQ